MANRNIKVTGTKRDDPDLRRLARALIDLAIQQSKLEDAAEDDVDAEHDKRAA